MERQRRVALTVLDFTHKIVIPDQPGEVPEVDLRVRIAKGEDRVLVLLVEQLEPEIELVPAARGVEL